MRVGDIQVCPSTLTFLAYGYLVLPCLVFFLGYLRIAVGIPAAVLLMYSFWRCLRSTSADCGDEVTVSRKVLLVIGFVVLAWTFFGGLGGFWFQTSDWMERNAIYRDLITRPWPVVYPSKGSALSYYIGHWMVPSVIPHLLYPAIGYDAAWLLGRLLLWAWTWLGVCLVVLELIQLVHAAGNKQQLVALVVFIFFSGMDIIGVILRHKLGEAFDPGLLHLERWADQAQFSSNTTCLYWVFNQSVAPWLATLCFLREKAPSNYVLLLVGSLLCGPFPTVGLAVLMFAKAVTWVVRSAREGRMASKEILIHLVSVQNVLVLLGAFSIVAMYLLSNKAASAGASILSGGDLIPTKRYIAFIVLEAGAFAAMVWHERSHDPLFYVAVVFLCICPFIRIGEGYDFTMRASIPALLLLMTWCLEMVLEKGDAKATRYRLRRAILIVCLAIGTITPSVEIYRGLYHAATDHLTENDGLYSIEDFDFVNTNFECPDYTDKPFFRYLAKTPHSQ
jgi:hypothetical protein